MQLNDGNFSLSGFGGTMLSVWTTRVDEDVVEDRAVQQQDHLIVNAEL